MSSKKKILMVMPVMKGGGAERVAALLLNEFSRNGYDCEFLLTSSKTEDIINRDLNPKIPIASVYKRQKVCYNDMINMEDYLNYRGEAAL